MLTIDLSQLARLSAQAAARPRLRLNHNIHQDLGDPIQRLLNAIEPGSYVRPHHHRDGVWELFCVLKGRIKAVTFAPDGRIEDSAEITAGEVVEFPSRSIHAVAALEPGTVVLEVKPGPYTPAEDKDFAPWAPAEGDPAAEEWMTWLVTAKPGDAFAERKA
ncbi:WbuC family cupin fold metalloprotein [Telmatospirillum sp. J64-1]|uniref:WbuC family cupin fold metalloprotein n=1 Tax=Telmatospirillum sp. J64-1 TaxID=2502183 RepID=UPI00115E0DF0|nr:WbuC family cupin fold metalloprotein [Telmatospirillum sp. J64-1]